MRGKPMYAGVPERCDVKRFINTYMYIIRLQSTTYTKQNTDNGLIEKLLSVLSDVMQNVLYVIRMGLHA